jgi:hypothetical protein
MQSVQEVFICSMGWDEQQSPGLAATLNYDLPGAAQGAAISEAEDRQSRREALEEQVRQIQTTDPSFVAFRKEDGTPVTLADVSEKPSRNAWVGPVSFAERERMAQEAWDATHNNPALDKTRPMPHEYRAGYHQAVIDRDREPTDTASLLAELEGIGYRLRRIATQLMANTEEKTDA